MDEMENQALPPEPEYTEEGPAEVTMDATENREIPLEPEEMETVPASEEPAAVEAPPAPQPPKRRSPYENSPYMMNHQPPVQTAPAVRETPKAKAPRKKRKIDWKVTILIVVLMAAALFSVLHGVNQSERMQLEIQALEAQIGVLREQLEAEQHVAGGNSVSGSPNVTADGLTPGQVYAQNLQSVVLIETDMATGSGFILTADGYVVTNYHVVEDGTSIRVVLHDRSYYDAELVGYEANNDVALLKMAGEGFQPAALGSSDALIVGDQVVAIGNPLGELTSTLTVGYVSAKERDVSTDSATINMIQTDCAINSGNSGGPLFNMKGEVVGITTAKYSGMSASGASIEGIGFAVPMDDVVGILEDLMEFGYVKSGYLGVGVFNVDVSEAAKFNLPLGCRVDSVTPGSCADLAGVRSADIIIGLGGHLIESYTDLARALREFDGGETTTITVYRSGQELTFSITLDAKPHETAVPQPGENDMPQDGSYEEWYDYFFGE